MKRVSSVPTAKRPLSFAPAPAAVPAGPAASPEAEDDYAQFGEAVSVEFLSMAGFLRRLPHRLSLDEANRLGAKVGAAADGQHVCYTTVLDRTLGPVRAFPVKLIERVYGVMAAEKGWPVVLDAETGLPDSARSEELVQRERLAKHLRAVLELAPNTELQHSTATLIQWLEAEVFKLRGTLQVPAGAARPVPSGAS